MVQKGDVMGGKFNQREKTILDNDQKGDKRKLDPWTSLWIRITYLIEKNQPSYRTLLIRDQIRSVTQSCPTLCDPMNRSTPGLPVRHQLLEFTQTHVHRVSDAIQPSHPLSSPSPPAPQSLPASGSFPLSQLFAWGGQSTGVSALASFLPKKSQSWSPSEWTGWMFLQSKGLTRVFSNTTVQNHQFFGAQPSSQSNSHIHTWPQEKP